MRKKKYTKWKKGHTPWDIRKRALGILKGTLEETGRVKIYFTKRNKKLLTKN